MGTGLLLCSLSDDARIFKSELPNSPLAEPEIQALEIMQKVCSQYVPDWREHYGFAFLLPASFRRNKSPEWPALIKDFR